MKTCTKCKAQKILSDFYRRSKSFDGLTAKCKSCAWETTRTARAKNKNKYKSKLYEWRKNNPEKVAALQLAWRRRNPETDRKSRAKWAANNRVKVNSSISKWKKNNSQKVASYNGQRRAVKLSATPAWANKFFIEEAYDLAKRRSLLKTGGIAKWHVDHIVPLKSNLVCGLHVEHNLQVIPAVVNVKKHNRHWPNMPENMYGEFEV